MQLPTVGGCATNFNLHRQYGDSNSSRVGFRSAKPYAWRQLPTVTSKRIAAISQTRINDQIRVTPIRVIDDEGNQLGIMPTADALAKARDADLDLVEVAPNSRPPVCRIMDYGKYKYDRNKRKAQSTHHAKTKEIRLRPKTGDHDIDFKVKQAVGFLNHKRQSASVHHLSRTRNGSY